MPEKTASTKPFSFKVVAKPWNVPADMVYAACLVENNWDDYGYSTLHNLFVFDLEGTKYEIGWVKIGQFPGPKVKNTTKLSRTFEELDEKYFSLGQDESYYENLIKLGAQIRDLVLKGLRDLAANPDIWIRARGLPVTQESLLRNVSEKSVEGQFRRMAQGGARLTSYHFTYKMPKRSASNQSPISLSFDVLPESFPPTNIHVLIGQNGVGKTYMLNQMTHALVAGKAVARQSGVFVMEDSDNQSKPFASLVSVTFSAFDPFIPIPESEAEPGNIKYSYIGLKRTRDTGKGIGTPKSTKMLAGEFVKSVDNCLRGPRSKQWQKAMQTLETDSIFRRVEISTLADLQQGDKFEKTAFQIFDRLSSGHKIVLLTITRLVENVEEQTLVLIDEPEAHLHPPLLSAFIRSLSDLLVDRNGVAIIATHSPVVLQEVPKSCVWMLRKTGNEARAERPESETFGENVGVLTREVFGLEVVQSGFQRMLNDAANDKVSFEAALEHFNNELGAEARAILRGLFITKNKDL